MIPRWTLFNPSAVEKERTDFPLFLPPGQSTDDKVLFFYGISPSSLGFGLLVIFLFNKRERE